MEKEFHTIKKSRMKTLKRWFDQEQSSGSGIHGFYLETKGKEFGHTHSYSCGNPNMFISSLIGWICRVIFVEKLDISLDDLLARVITRYHEERRRHIQENNKKEDKIGDIVAATFEKINKKYGGANNGRKEK